MKNIHPCTKEPLLGSGPLERALVRQWVLYLTGCIEPADRKEKLTLLRRVNEHLATSSHLAGASLTAADVLMFHSIHKIFSELTFQEKDKLMNLSRWVIQTGLKTFTLFEQSRWFRSLQQDQKLRRGKQKILFSRSKLY